MCKPNNFVVVKYSTECPSGFVNCQNDTVTECVPNSVICNWISDCSTNFDEAVCIGGKYRRCTSVVSYL